MNPSITYNQAFAEDFFNFTGLNWQATTTTATITNNDYAVLAGTGYITNNTAFTISTTLYPLIVFRYKTVGASATAKIVATFSDATTQTVLADTATTSTWQTGIVTLTAAKTLSTLQLYADNAAAQTVYYDFVMVCSGQFSFPQWDKFKVKLANLNPKLISPGKITNIHQYLGADSATVELAGDIDDTNPAWTRLNDAIPAAIFYQWQHQASTEVFQWFTSDRGNFKIQLDTAELDEADGRSKFKYTYEVDAHEYSLGDKGQETYIDRFGLTQIAVGSGSGE